MTAIAGFLLLSLFAQAETFEEKLQKELEKPFLKKVAWVVDFDEAMAQSKASGKLILGYFTRSWAP